MSCQRLDQPTKIVFRSCGYSGASQASATILALQMVFSARRPEKQLEHFRATMSFRSRGRFPNVLTWLSGPQSVLWLRQNHGPRLNLSLSVSQN